MSPAIRTTLALTSILVLSACTSFGSEPGTNTGNDSRPTFLSDAEIVGPFLAAATESDIGLISEFSWDATGEVDFLALPECGIEESPTWVAFHFSASTGQLTGDWDAYRALEVGQICPVSSVSVTDWRDASSSLYDARTQALRDASDDLAVVNYRARAWAALSVPWVDYSATAQSLLWDGETCQVTGPSYTYELPILTSTKYESSVNILELPSSDIVLGESGVFCFPERTSLRFYPGQ